MLKPGQEPVPGYRLEAFLGRGQFGEVWRASAPGGTHCALKFIRLDGKKGSKEFRGTQRVKEIRHAHLMPTTALWLLDDEGKVLGDTSLANLEREQKRSSLNIGETMQPSDTDVEVGVRSSTPPAWLVVAMLLGEKNLFDVLEQHVADGRKGIPPDELIRYTEEAAKGIDFLNTPRHDLGEGPVSIQHCDIKPANIMLVGDSVVVCDFGLATVLAGAGIAATASGMSGSLAYMAPECMDGKPSNASDQYSLAVSYYELRTGDLPFRDQSPSAVLVAHREGRLDLSALPAPERKVIARATSVHPEDRFPSASAMAVALRRAVEGDRVAPARSSRALAVLLALAALLLVAVVTGAITFPLWRPLLPFGGDDAADVAEDDAIPSDDGADEVVVPAVTTYTVNVDPPDATVTVDGSPVETAAGAFELEIDDDTPKRIVVRRPGGYATLDRDFTRADLADLSFRLNLEWTTEHYAAAAREEWAAGDKAEAARLFAEAIRRDDSYDAIPPALSLKGHAKAVRRVITTADGRWLITAGDDKAVHLWDLAADAPESTRVEWTGQPGLIEGLAASSNGKWLAVVGRRGTARLYSLDEPQSAGAAPIDLPGHAGSDVLSAAFAPIDRSRPIGNYHLAMGDSGQNLQLWTWRDDPRQAKAASLVGHADQIIALAFAAAGELLVSVGDQGEIFLWQVDDPAAPPVVLASGKTETFVKCAALSPDGRWVATGRDSNDVLLHSLKQGDEPLRLVGHADDIESLAFDSSGKKLITGGGMSDRTARIWNLTEQDPTLRAKVLEGHSGPISSVAISPGGQWAATGSYDTSVRLWSLAEEGAGQPFLELSGHQSPVTVVRFTPGGGSLITTSNDGDVRVWDVDAIELLLMSRAISP